MLFHVLALLLYSFPVGMLFHVLALLGLSFLVGMLFHILALLGFSSSGYAIPCTCFINIRVF